MCVHIDTCIFTNVAKIKEEEEVVMENANNSEGWVWKIKKEFTMSF